MIRTFKQFLAYAQNMRLATLNQAQGWFKIFTPLVFGIQKFILSLKRKINFVVEIDWKHSKLIPVRTDFHLCSEYRVHK